MKKKNLTLRPFLEKIETYCGTLDQTCLAELILSLARQVEAKNRHDYLEMLLSILPKNNEERSSTIEANLKTCLKGIATLHKEVSNRLESIEDGSYWHDPDDDYWDEYHYDDDDPESMNNEQIEKFVEYCREARQFFLDGYKQEARKMYKHLFEIIDKVSSYCVSPEMDIEMVEERACYIRCILDLEKGKRRAEVVFDAMYPVMVENDFEGIVADDLPVLQDVLDAAPQPPKEMDNFIPSWRKILGKQDAADDRIADLILEAVQLSDGVENVACLAREWGSRQPKGYLYWLQLLEEREKWQEVADGCRSALAELTNSMDREVVSERLITAGEKLGKPEMVLDGFREKFHADPEVSNLVTLVAEAKSQNRRKEELEAALLFCNSQGPDDDEEQLITRILMMDGQLHEAFRREEQGEQVGWSSSGVGLIYFSVLHLLCNSSKNCTLVEDGLRYYTDLEGKLYYEFKEMEIGDAAEYKEVIVGLKEVTLTVEESQKYFTWCHSMADRRIQHIVSNKYRKAYARAALVLGALAECLAFRNEKQKALALIDDYYKVKFSRFRAFRGEVREVVERSGLVREWGELL